MSRVRAGPDESSSVPGPGTSELARGGDDERGSALLGERTRRWRRRGDIRCLLDRNVGPHRTRHRQWYDGYRIRGEDENDDVVKIIIIPVAVDPRRIGRTRICEEG